MLTLSEAAKETGLTRSAIFKAIKSGKLSATKDEHGRFQIDPAELFRVYNPVDKKPLTSEQRATAKDIAETAELRTRLEFMGELLRQVEGERDDLRRRLDEESAERRKLTALLTHQPPASNTHETPPARFSFWQRLTGKG